MLRFTCIPDQAFDAIVTGSLELAFDMLRDECGAHDALVDPRLEGMFTRAELAAEVEKLLLAHKSDTLYGLTEYHWLILYCVLEDGVALHNDGVKEDGARAIGGVLLAEIDFDGVVNVYFWDEDFLFDPDAYAGLSDQQKAELQFTDTTFGVVNRLKPHPEELILEVCPKDDRAASEDLYRPGEDYPCFVGP